ncbi:hypothetical protein Droror1_Dr00024055 [Drosera rotundifolia]
MRAGVPLPGERTAASLADLVSQGTGLPSSSTANPCPAAAQFAFWLPSVRVEQLELDLDLVVLETRRGAAGVLPHEPFELLEPFVFQDRVLCVLKLPSREAVEELWLSLG